MKKIFKIIIVIIIILIASIFLIPVIFKGKIIETVKTEANNNLNASLDFSDINLSLISNFPKLTAEIKNLSIIGKDTFAADTLIKIKTLKTTVNLKSLISGDEIKINDISLLNPDIKIKILQNGIANYDITKEDTANTENNDTNDENSSFKLNFENFEIKNGNILYDDKESDVFALLENINFKLSGDMTQDITNLNLKMTTDSMTVASEGIKYLNKVKTVFDSELKADLEKSIYTFKNNNLKLNEIDMGFNGKVEMPEDDIILDLTFKTKDTKFKDALSMVPAIYKTDFEDLETNGNFKIDGYVKGTYNDNNMPAYGIKIIVKNARLKYPDLPESVENININMQVDAEEGTGENMTIDIKKANITTAGNPFYAGIFIKMTAEDTEMNGNIKGKINFNSIKDIIDLDDTSISGILNADVNFNGKLSDIENENYEKFDANGNLQINNMTITTPDMPEINIQKADMYLSPQFVNLKQFNSKIGKSDLNLNGKLNNIFSYVFKDELLSGTFNFNSNYLDIDELSGTNSEQEISENENNGTLQETPDDEIVKIPKNIDFTLNSNIKKIKYDNLEISDAKGKIIIKDGKLDLNDIKMNMLGGEIQIAGYYDTKNLSKPEIDFKLKMNKINISDAVKTFTSVKTIAPITENCTGDINADINLNSLLKQDMTPILASLISSGNLSSDNISISKNGLLEKLADKTKQNKFKSPEVNNLNLKYYMENGNLTIKPSTFKLAGTEVTLGGTQSIDKKLDLNLNMKLPKNIASNFMKGITNNNNENTEIKTKIGGTADNPKITGFSSSLSDNITDEMQDKTNDIKKQAEEKANKIIENAQKKADAVIAEAEKQAANIRSQADKKGKQLIAEAEKQGNKLIEEAKNPITKKAAEISKQEMVNQAKKQAANINKQADKQANNIIKTAQTKADKIISDAKKRAANY